MGRLQGKVALVMGASRPNNMGQAIARRFLAEGARVVVSGRGQAGLEKFASQTGAGARTCDIRRKYEIVALRDHVIDMHGGIDIAVNAAATGSYGPFEQTTGQTFHVTGGLTLRRNPTAAEIGASVATASAVDATHGPP